VDNTTQENISTRYETEYEYDGMGRTTRERTLQYQAGTVDMEVILRDVQTSYDLGDNPTEIKFYDKDGWAYTLTQTFAQGYQITDVSHSAAADVTVNTSGSFTYDTNNNLTGTKEFDAVRSSAQLAYRGNWTFTYDRANRLKSYTNTNSSNVRGNNWYDSKGKVWQRWTDNTSTSQWDNTLKRFVYDGGQLVQEHDWTVIDNFGTWVYTYADIDRDYQRHPGGMTQRQGTAASYTDYYMQNSAAAIEYKTERDPASATIARDERTKDFDQLAGSTFANISNLATSNSFIEMYGGGTGGTPAGFDGLMQFSDRHMLAGFGRWLTLRGNNSQAAGGSGVTTFPAQIAGVGIVQDGDELSPIPQSDPWDPIRGTRCRRCIDRTMSLCQGEFQYYACWRFDTNDWPKEFVCHLDLINCSSCEGRGIQCIEDLDNCYSILGGDHAEYGCSGILPSPACTADEAVKIMAAKNRVYQRLNDGDNCIDDPILKHCIEKVLTGTFNIGFNEYIFPGFYCNSPKCGTSGAPDSYNNFGWTCCPGISLCMINIMTQRPTYWEIFLEAMILHEVTHWCMNCAFKRPGPASNNAASACHYRCYESQKIGSGHETYATHQPHDTVLYVRSACGVCAPNRLPSEHISNPPSTKF